MIQFIDEATAATEEKKPPDNFIQPQSQVMGPPPPPYDMQPGAFDPQQAPQDNQQETDPHFTAEAITETLDAFQFLGFFMLIKRKLRGKYFESSKEFKRAVDLKHTPKAEIEKDEENRAENESLVNRYDAYIKKLEDKTRDLNFTPEEEMMLKRPLEKLVQRYPGLDLPPGLALAIAGVTITIPRVMKLNEE